MVKKEYLVLIAALVWTAAGANILRLGIAASLVVQWEWWMYLSAVAVLKMSESSNTAYARTSPSAISIAPTPRSFGTAPVR